MAKNTNAASKSLAAAYFSRTEVDGYGDEITIQVSDVYVDTLEKIKAAVDQARNLAPEIEREGDVSWSVHYTIITPEKDAAAFLRDVQETWP